MPITDKQSRLMGVAAVDCHQIAPGGGVTSILPARELRLTFGPAKDAPVWYCSVELQKDLTVLQVAEALQGLAEQIRHAESVYGFPVLTIGSL